ncbi:MAG TPA: MbnP family protein [Edaphocola sp.]|nr:MbnP family protein [Edaphocola sp.]
MKKLLLIGILLGLAMLVSCDKTKNGKNDNGHLSFKINNVVGNDLMQLQSGNYINAAGNHFTINKYAYYLSNFELIKEDGSVFKIPDSYVLINESEPESKNFKFSDIPRGDYTSLRLVLGVDSTRNVSGAQSGALDPIHGMFWDWNTGYIMAKMEGFSPESGGAANIISFHLGGYDGRYSAVKSVEFPLNPVLKIDKSNSPTITLQSDLLTWFDGFPALDFATTPSVMSIGSESFDLSERYKNHLSVQQVEN